MSQKAVEQAVWEENPDALAVDVERVSLRVFAVTVTEEGGYHERFMLIVESRKDERK